jgi:hypothetical protein
LKGDGNSYDFGARMYDPRIGRWFSRDLLERKYSMLSPYSAFRNNPNFYVDKDGNEDVIYIINVPDGKGRKSISDVELQKRIDKANVILKSKAEKGGYELKTRYVLYTSNQIPFRGPFNRANMDNSDGVILMGNSEDIKSYDRKYNITGFDESQNAKGEKGWMPIKKPETGGLIVNPENTVQGDKRGGYIDTKTTSEDEQIYLMLHSAGHMKKVPNTYDDDHISNESNPNIMLSGEEKSAYLRHNPKSRVKDLWSSKLPYNDGFKNRMITNFGNKTAVDNYDKNKANNDKQIGPRKEDGSF